MKSPVFFLLCMLAGATQAADYICAGKVKHLNQGRSGRVSLISPDIYGGQAGRVVCSVTETWKAVDPEVCKGWLSKLLMAKAADKRIIVQYVDSHSCKTQPTWNDANAPYAFWEAE